MSKDNIIDVEFEEEEEMEIKESRLKKVGRFVKNHKKAFIIGAVAGLGIGGLLGIGHIINQKIELPDLTDTDIPTDDLAGDIVKDVVDEVKNENF